MNIFTTRNNILAALVWLFCLIQPAAADGFEKTNYASKNSQAPDLAGEFAPMPPPCILIQNPSFDATLSDWQVSGNVNSTTDAYAGNYAALINTFASNLYQFQSGITEGNIYTVSAFAKRAGSTWWTGIGIAFYDSSNNLLSDNYTSVLSSTYTEHKVSAIAPTGAVAVEIYATQFGFGTLTVDEFCLEEIVPVVGECILVQNTSFENAFSNWFGSGSANIVNDPNSGTSAAELISNGTYVYQRLSILPGQDYELNAYAKVGSNAPSYAEIFIDWRDASNNLINTVYQPVLPEITDYAYFSLKGIAPSNAAYADVGAYKTGSSNRRLYVDDFCFSITDPLGGNNFDLSCGCSDNLLPNGGYEQNDVSSYPYSIEGIDAAALDDGDDDAIKPYKPDISSDYFFYLNDQADAVNNPEGDHFIWLADRDDEWEAKAKFTKNLLLENGQSYTLCLYAAAWTASLNGSGLPDGGTEPQLSGVLNLGFDFESGSREVFAWSVPSATSFNNLSWTKLTYTFIYNETDPIKKFSLINDRNNVGMAIDAVSLTRTNCLPTKDCGINGLVYQRWEGIPSFDLRELLWDKDFPNNYDYSGLITNYQGPVNIGGDYGSRAFGYIVPSLTGNYTFNVTGDDDVLFYLSTDSTYTNKSVVAYVDGWTYITQHTKYASQTSPTIYLEAGKKYYTEVLHKEGWGGDHFQVYWRTPASGSWNIVPNANLQPICYQEICDNGRDDDYDGLVDCADDDCSGALGNNYTVIDENCGSGGGEIDLTVSSTDSPFSFIWSDMPITANWTFEGTTDDESGNLNHANIMQGSLTYPTDQVEGRNSAYFNGSTRIRYSIDNGFMEQAFNALTVSMWIKPDNLSGIQTLFDEGGSTGGRGMAIRLNNNKLSAGVRNGGSSLFYDESHVFPNDGQWHHVAAVFDNGNFTVYLDGVASTTQATSYSTINNHGNNGGIGGSFGGSVLNSGSTRYRGYMDDVRYHLIGMTPDQIADMARNDGDRTNLFAGIYTVNVETSTGCTYTETITVNSSANHDNGGQINGNESSCVANFDPSPISSTSPASGGGAGTTEYQWQVSTDGLTWADIAGATNTTYDPPMIAVTSLYRRGGRLAPCLAWVYSNTIQKTITENFTDAGQIAGNEEYCNGYDPALITENLSPSGGLGGSVELQWQQSTDTITWADIPGATSATYDPAFISQTTYFRRGARRSPCASYVFTPFIEKSVVVNYTSAGIIAGEESNCGSFDPDLISSVTPPSGGTAGTNQYQWEQSTDSITWTAIPGGNAETFNPTTVIQTTYFRRGARRLPCSDFEYSNVITKMMVMNFTAGGILDGDQSVCGSYDPFTMTSIAAPSGGIDGTLTYQWQQSTDGGLLWTPIPGATSEEYDPGVLTQTTLYRRQARRSPCAAWINANVIIKEVRDLPAPVFASSPTQVNGYICEWVSYDFEAQDEGAGAAYQWNFGIYAIPNTAIGIGPHSVTYNIPSVAASTQVTAELTVLKDGCAGVSTLDFNVRPQIVVTGISVTDPTNCAVGDGAIQVSTSHPAGTSVQASIDSGTTWYAEPINITGLSAGIYELWLRYDAGECEQVWGNVTLADPGSLTASIQLSTTEVCNNGFFTVEAIPSGIGSPAYAWDFGPGASPVIAYGVGPHLVTYSTGGEKTISLVITENFCTGSVDTSITIVSTYTDGGTLTGAENLCSVGPGSVMTTDVPPTGGYAGTPEYQWETRADDGAGGWTAWAEIAGATAESYTPALISITTQFRRKARRSPCSGWAYSAVVEKRVSGIPQPQNDIYTSACPGFLFYDYVNLNDLNLINPTYSIAVPPTNGTLDLDADGEFVYTPNSFFCGTDAFTYTVCNNGTTCCANATVTIDMGDTAPPVLQNTPGDIVISCDDEMPLPPIVNAWENCQNVILGLDEASNQGEADSCSIYNYTFYRTWTASDYCGNNVSEQQAITIQDQTAPGIYRVYTLPNGAKMVAGVMENVSNRWKTIGFPVQFATKPVVFAQIVTNNDDITVNARMRNVSTAQFQLRVQEEENEDDLHLVESVAWIAVEEGVNTENIPFEIGTTLLSSSPATVNFDQPYPTPGFIGKPQTNNENNPITLRINSLNSTSANIFLQEEDSFDPEVNHGFETVGYMAMDGAGDFHNSDGEVIGEIGQISFDHNLLTVNLNHTYHNPVVVFGGITMNGAQEGVIRVENLTSTSFQVRIEEWEYNDGAHLIEDFTYLVVEGSIPFNQTVDCNNIPAIPTIGVEIIGKDNCDQSTPLTVTDSPFVFDCENDTTYTRTFHVQDECGNETTLVQVFTLRDTMPPSFTVPADVTITCLTDENDLNITGDVTDEYDNCVASLEATYVDDWANVSGCVGYILRLWSLEDLCGNNVSQLQTITLYNDNDADKDGLPDPFDLDDDNDGIPDIVEGTGDTDDDGIPDSQDLDSDNDGIPDIIEAGFYDSNGDGIVDTYGAPDWDVDNDGLANIVDADPNDPSESASVNFNPTSSVTDVDGDGVPNYIDLDSDNDGIPDLIEAGGVDTDGNGVIEYPLPGVAESILDADGDGFSDFFDPDDDTAFGIDQSGDVLVTYSNGTYMGGDSSFNPDFDGDGIPNFYDLDSDNDGIADLIESGGVDTDGDGTIDAGEFADVNNNGFNDQYENAGLITTDPDGATPDGLPEDDDGDGTAYNGGDADADGSPNFLDTDSDNDGINDIIEIGYASLDSNSDGALDSFTDGNTDGFDDNMTGTIFTDSDGATNDGRPEDSADADSSPYNGTISDGTFGELNGEPDLDDDGDGVPNFLDTDSDNDLIRDNLEDKNGNGTTDEGETGWLDTDTDDDLIPDGVEDANQDGEYQIGIETDPLNPDTDGDGLDDGFEDANQNGTVDGAGESDPKDPCDPLVNPSCVGVVVDVRVKLQGAVIDNLGSPDMRDNLREKNLIPMEEPYTDLPNFNHVGEGGGEVMYPGLLSATGPDAVIDWVMIELRSPIDPSNIIATRSALLKRDGTVTDMDGSSKVYFSQVPSGSYFVSVKHRNHLGIATGQSVLLSPFTPKIDFAAPNADLWDNFAAADQNNQLALWPGDVNSNGDVIFQGPANDVIFILFHVMTESENVDNLANYISLGYTTYDVNLDGYTIFQGPNNDKAKILFHSILGSEENMAHLANFILSVKLP